MCCRHGAEVRDGPTWMSPRSPECHPPTRVAAIVWIALVLEVAACTSTTAGTGAVDATNATVSVAASPRSGTLATEPEPCSQLSSRLSKPINELNSATTTSDKLTALTDLSVAYSSLAGRVDTTTPLYDVFLEAANLAGELGLAGAANGTDDVTGLKADMATVAKSCPAETSLLTGSADAAARAAP